MASAGIEVSLENPTRQYLDLNYRKLELQKHCRDIGISKVWVTKDKLIDMIIEKHRSSHTNSDGDDDQEQLPEDTRKCIEELREKINVRDLDIDELNEHLKAAYVTINKLSDRLSTLEDQVKQLQESRNASTTQTATPTDQTLAPPQVQARGTLLLGDENLICARTTDVKNDCSIRTIKGANIDLLKCWVEEKLLWIPGNCIIYCGFQDIVDGSTLVDIFDRLGSLISSLKQINSDMHIYICELVPATNTQDLEKSVDDFNTKLINWNLENGISTIKSNLQFKLGTGERDHMCFTTNNISNEHHLNRFGMMRMLSIIASQCDSFNLHDNWQNIVNQATSEILNDQQENMRNKHYNEPSRNINIRSRRYSQNNRSREAGNPTSRRIVNDNGLANIAGHLRHTASENGRRYSQGNNVNRYNNFYGTHANYSSQNEGFSYQSRSLSCHNCGETNHQLSNCRHKYRIKCSICNRLGHKTRLCRDYA